MYSRDHHVIEKAHELEQQVTRLEGHKKDEHLPICYWPSFYYDLQINLEMAHSDRLYSLNHSFDYDLEENPCTCVYCEKFDFNPDPLVRLCLVEVSMCVGFKADRNERISQTGLYPSLQRRLMFSS